MVSSAPRRSSRSARSALARSHAEAHTKCSGVIPLSAFALTLAPRCSRASMPSPEPKSAAEWGGVHPPDSILASRSAPASTSCGMKAVLFRRAASCRTVTPSRPVVKFTSAPSAKRTSTVEVRSLSTQALGESSSRCRRNSGPPPSATTITGYRRGRDVPRDELGIHLWNI